MTLNSINFAGWWSGGQNIVGGPSETGIRLIGFDDGTIITRTRRTAFPFLSSSTNFLHRFLRAAASLFLHRITSQRYSSRGNRLGWTTADAADLGHLDSSKDWLQKWMYIKQKRAMFCNSRQPSNYVCLLSFIIHVRRFIIHTFLGTFLLHSFGNIY